MLSHDPVTMDVGWPILLEEGIRPLEHYLETGTAPETVAGAGELPPDTLEKIRLDYLPVPPPETIKLFRPQRYMKLYDIVYALASDRSSDTNVVMLYKEYSNAIAGYLQRCVSPSLEKSSAQSADVFLLDMRRRWENHLTYVQWLRRLFDYVDRAYSQALRKASLYRRGLELFHEHIFNVHRARLTSELLDLVDRDREGVRINRDLVRSLISIYVKLSKSPDYPELYQAEFEEALLPRTRAYYTQKSGVWLKTHSFPKYLEVVESTLADERKRAATYFHSTSKPKVLAVCQVGLLTSRMPELLALDGPIDRLLEMNSTPDLQRCFLLFGLLESGYEPIAEAFRSFCLNKVEAIMQKHSTALLAELSGGSSGGAASSSAPSKVARPVIQKQLASHPEIVEDLIAAYSHLNSLLIKCFDQELSFQRALKEAFETKINRNIGPHTPAAVLCTYADQVLRGACDEAAADAAESKLSYVISLFLFLTDKDLFAEIYRNQLARRLLAPGGSPDRELERLVLCKLKMACGTQFTARHEGMLTDLSKADEIQAAFEKSIRETYQASSEKSLPQLLLNGFRATVLTCGHWPTYENVECILPDEMQRCLNEFEQDYCNVQTNHRKLEWVHHLGTVLITLSFDAADKNGNVSAGASGQTIDLQCNTTQAAILFLFQNRDTGLSTAEIQRKTNLPLSHLKKLLTCLAVSKVLCKTADADGEEVYAVNDNLPFKAGRVLKIPIPAREETHAKEKTEENRSVAIEAAIVRFMKTHRSAEHDQLVSEIVKILPLFRPSAQQVKEKLDDLIDKDFVKRDDSNVSQPPLWMFSSGVGFPSIVLQPTTYHYVP